MEKLHELLQQFQLEKWGWVRLAWPDVEVNDKEELILGATLISKKYWFIKWLVENEKIKSEWIKPRADLVKEVIILDRKTNKPIWMENQYTEVEQLLMYLAIQDEPLEFLASILK